MRDGSYRDNLEESAKCIEGGEEHDKIVRNEKIIFECQPDRSGGPDVLAVYRLCAPGYKG